MAKRYCQHSDLTALLRSVIIVVMLHISTDRSTRWIVEDPFDKFVDVLEAGRTLNIHPESVRRLIRNGKLPAQKYANKWLIRRDVLEQFAARYDGRPGAKATLI
jgi:excisionase family DNA binding protein